MEIYADLMFHDAVADLQKADGSYEKFQKFYPHRTDAALTGDDIAFIAARESFYIASVTPQGWPYIQHRGGPVGFLRVTGPNQLACADYPGNRQFLTMGNLAGGGQVSLFLMDYQNQARLKILGRARLVPVAEADPRLVAQLDQTMAPAERVLVIDVVARDWNCPKYIPRLYAEAALRDVVGPQIAALKEENAALRAELAALKAAPEA